MTLRHYIMKDITVGYSENLGSASTRKLSTNNITTIG